MTETNPQVATPNYPHRPAAFINALSEEGTKAELIQWLQTTWNERCALAAQQPGRKLTEEIRVDANGNAV